MTVTSVTAVALSFRATSVSPASEPATTTTSPRAAAAARRADTLVSRLDTDEDGAVSKDEFTSGAIDLLKRASVREHHRHVGRGEGIEKRDAKWLARLERAFDRIDANSDGALDQGEVAAQLTPKERPGRPASQAAEPSSPAPAPTSVTSVTIVAIAIRRYTVDAAAAPAPPATESAPAQETPAPEVAPATAPTELTEAAHVPQELQPAA